MIIFCGAPGSGKSVQGQIMAARHDWRWLSAGQLLRDSHDTEILKQISSGSLVKSDLIYGLVEEALHRAKQIDRVILDGFPRQLVQAQWLIDNLPKHSRSVAAVLVLKVPETELSRRLNLRGRVDDTADIINKRLAVQDKQTADILNYFRQLGINVCELDGLGTVGEVHDRIETELERCAIV